MDACIWMPQEKQKTTMWKFLQWLNIKETLTLEGYHSLHQWSIENPGRFWLDVAEFLNLHFDTAPTQILNEWKHPLDAHWFEGARFNFAQKLLSRNDNHPALICINERQHRKVITYMELRRLVAACASSLRTSGIKSGDRVVGVLPNDAYAVIAMLATASIGAVWASCSSDFGAQAIIDRLGQIEPKALFITNGHYYNGKTHPADKKIQQIIDAIPSLKTCVLCPVIEDAMPSVIEASCQHWDDFLSEETELSFTSLPFAHPLYILFSSGTTGKPKCMVHSAGGTLLQHMKELALHCDIHPEDNLCFYTTTGWMMWNWMVSTLSLGARLTLYEGSPSYPDPYHLFELIEKEGITHFGTGAKFISALEKAGVYPKNRFKMPSLRMILSTGSPLLPKNYDYVLKEIKPDVQLCSISGGSDIISCFALGNPISPVYRGELQGPGLGMDVCVYNNEGQSVIEEKGELVCRQPFPSMPIAFWNDPDKKRYYQAYFSRFEGVWAHGDFASITKHKGLIIYGRSDAVLNPGGVRIGTAEIYRQVEKIPEVVDSVVIGQPWNDDERIILFVQLQEDIQLNDPLKQHIRDTIRQHTSPRHVPAKIIQVSDIPRTLSGKTVELAVKQVVCGQSVNNIESLANPEALELFKYIPDLEQPAIK